jgi:hypothetical protein
VLKDFSSPGLYVLPHACAQQSWGSQIFPFSPAVRPLAAAAAQLNKHQTPSFEFYLLANTYSLLNFQEKCPLSSYHRRQNVFRRKISFRKIAYLWLKIADTILKVTG